MVIPSAPEHAVLDAAAARLVVWMARLRRELDLAITAAEAGDDEAASAFLVILSRVFDKLNDAFLRYSAPSDASITERLKWLQQVGSGLALIVSHLGLLDHSTQPRKSALAASYMRQLDSLMKGASAILLPVRFFNYELMEIHSDRFVDLLQDDVDDFEWPILFLRLPTGILDSPRNHVLLSHELGHAIAAVGREKQVRHARLETRARRTGSAIPEGPKPLYSIPELPIEQLFVICEKQWDELGRPPVALPPTGGQFTVGDWLFLEHHAAVVERFQGVVEAWLEEVFADAVGLNLFGPAFLLGSLDVFLPTGEFNRASDDHPPTGFRIQLQFESLRTGAAGDRLSELPDAVFSRIEAITKEATATLGSGLTEEETPSETDFTALAYETVRAATKSVLDAADHCCHGCTYTAEALRADIAAYLQDLTDFGVPPIGTPNDRRVTLATILNVGWIAAQTSTHESDGPSERLFNEEKLDNLLSKAIELSEVQIAWEEA